MRSMWKILSRGVNTATRDLVWRRVNDPLHHRPICHSNAWFGGVHETRRTSSVDDFRRSLYERRRFCTLKNNENGAIPNHSRNIDEVRKNDEIVRIPVPEGIPTDRMRTYLIKDSSRTILEMKGEDCMFVVHGPEEVWAPKGLVKGHGAEGGIFAVVSSYCGSQFKVMEGDVIYTNRVRGEVNSEHIFDNVLLIGAVDWSIFGRPLIRGASVVTTIEEQAKSGKIYVTKFKKRTGYKRRQGHRQLITRFRVREIRYSLPDASSFVEFDIDDHIASDPLKRSPNFRFRL